jgi:hypothetical protein
MPRPKRQLTPDKAVRIRRHFSAAFYSPGRSPQLKNSFVAGSSGYYAELAFKDLPNFGRDSAPEELQAGMAALAKWCCPSPYFTAGLPRSFTLEGTLSRALGDRVKECGRVK